MRVNIIKEKRGRGRDEEKKKTKNASSCRVLLIALSLLILSLFLTPAYQLPIFLFLLYFCSLLIILFFAFPFFPPSQPDKCAYIDHKYFNVKQCFALHTDSAYCFNTFIYFFLSSNYHLLLCKHFRV